MTDTMLLAILSDIHANLPALEAVLDDLKGIHPEMILVAGDLTAGPFPNETLALLREIHARMILGNTDLNLLRYVEGSGPAAWRASKQYGLLRWNSRNISPENLRFLGGLPEQMVVHLPGLDPIRVVHGTPRDPYEPIFPQRDLSILDLSLEMIEEPVLICGHTHEPWFLRRNGKLAVNPGSVAVPLNGETGAQYARLVWSQEHWQVQLRTIRYDRTALRQAFATSGLLAEGGALARVFLLSMETGRDYSLVFFNHAYQLAEQAGYPGSGVLPDEIWDRATETFDWPE